MRINMRKKGCVILCIALMVMMLGMPYGSAESTDVPEWKVGQDFSMGMKVDVGKLAEPAINEMKDMEGADVNVDVNGEVGYFLKLEVAGEETLGGEDTYKADIYSHFTADVDFHMDMTMNNEFYSGDSKVDASAKIDVKTTGFAWFVKDTLALAEIELTTTVETFDVSAKMESTTTYEGEKQTINADYTMKGDGIEIKDTVSFDPALDIFQFPIEVGESWVVESTATYDREAKGIIKVSGEAESSDPETERYMGGYQAEDIDLSDAEYQIKEETEKISISLKCTGTKEITLEDGTTVTAYVIRLDESFYGTMTQFGQSFTDVGGYESSYESSVYYSPDEGFVTQMGITDDQGNELAVMEPAGPDDDSKYVAGGGMDFGGSFLLMAGIGIAAVVIVLVVVLMLGKKKKAKPATPPQPYQQPYQQQPPPQQYQQPPPPGQQQQPPPQQYQQPPPQQYQQPPPPGQQQQPPPRQYRQRPPQ